MSLSVAGGAGGVRANLDELSRLATAVQTEAESSTHIAAAVAALATEPDFLVSSALDPLGATEVVAALGLAVERLTAYIAGQVILAGAVRAAAVAYQLSDLETSELLTAGWHELPPPVLAAAAVVVAGAGLVWVGERAVVRAGLDAPAAAHALAQGRDVGEVAAASGQHLRDDLAGDGAVLLEWMVRHPDVSREALATIALAAGPLLPGDPQPGGASVGMAGVSALLLAGGRSVGLFASKPVRVTAVHTRTQAGPTSVRDLTARLARLTTPRGTLQGYQPNKAGVLIDRVPGAGGSPPRWIVYVPPTSDWGVTGGRYPSDLTSNVAMVSKEGPRTGQRPDSVVQALTAMRRAGIRPGEPVMLVGFSQGGITAAALASDPAVRQEYNVEAVLTEGAPISEFALDDVAVLSIENDADLIPELDGAQNPDQPNWTTVNADVLDPQSGDQLTRQRVDDGEPFAGHYLDGYLRTAEQVDQSPHQSVQQWRDAAAPFLAGDDVTTIEVTVEREP